MSLRRNFTSDTVTGHVELHNLRFSVVVKESRAPFRKFSRSRDFPDRESARKVYQSFVRFIDLSGQKFRFDDIPTR